MVKCLNLKIACPVYNEKQDIQYRYTYTPEGQILFSPFSGCDNMNGCELCTQCIKRENAFIGSLPSLEELLNRYQASEPCQQASR